MVLLRNDHTAKLGASAPNAGRRHSWVLLLRNLLAARGDDVKNGCNCSEIGCEGRPFSNAFCPLGAIAPKWVQLLRNMHAQNTEKVSFWPIIGWFCSEKRWLSAGETLGAIAPNYAAYGFEFSDPGCTAHYMDTLLDIVKGYKDNQKDDFLAISVIQTCIDVVPDFYHLPKNLQKTVKHQLGIDEKVKIESIALSNEQQMSLKKQVANILYSTRNSIVHAKSNYEPNGLECPPDSLEEVNQMMSSIGRALIQWNENQADYIRA